MAFPSTFLDVQRSVGAKLRLDVRFDTGTGLGADAQPVRDWINQVYAQVAVECEAFQRCDTMNFTAGVASYTIPFQVLRIKELVTRTGSDGGWSAPLEQTTIDDILGRRQSTGAVPAADGQVRSYALSGHQRFEVYPTPASGADLVRFYYVHLPTLLSGDTDIPQLQEPFSSKLLEYGALAEAGDFIKDPFTNDYRQLFEMWLRKYRQHLSRKQGGHVRVIQVAGMRPYRPHDPSTDIAVYG